MQKKLLARTHLNGGIWTTREIMEYLQENYPEKKLGTTSLYYWIREKMGMTYRKKRPKNESSSDKDVESFKTELPNVLDNFKEKTGAKPRLFFMDEHRMGLQLILRKQWLFPRERYQKIHIGYSWLWGYGFVEPNTGENHHYVFGNLNSTCFEKISILLLKARIYREIILSFSFLMVPLLIEQKHSRFQKAFISFAPYDPKWFARVATSRRSLANDERKYSKQLYIFTGIFRDYL